MWVCLGGIEVCEFKRCYSGKKEGVWSRVAQEAGDTQEQEKSSARKVAPPKVQSSWGACVEGEGWCRIKSQKTRGERGGLGQW